MRLDFAAPDGRTLVLTHDAYARMVRYRQRQWWQKEAGGVLLGRHLLETGDYVIDEVTVPQRQDRRTRTSFYRSEIHHQIARAKWDESGGTIAYLGSWHTHPEADPSPSGVDRNDWAGATRKDTFEGTRLFFLILGVERLRVWTKTRRSCVHELHLKAHHPTSCDQR